jgi:hypothetical protein
VAISFSNFEVEPGFHNNWNDSWRISNSTIQFRVFG